MNLKQLVLTSLKLVVTGGILWYFSTVIDWSTLLQTLRKIEPKFVMLICAILAVRAWFLSVRFQALVAPLKHIGTGTLFRHVSISGMFNVLLPSSIAGEGVRVFLLEKEGMTKGVSVFYLLVERCFGILALFLISAPLAVLFPVPQWIVWICVGGAILGIISSLWLCLSSKSFPELRTGAFWKTLSTEITRLRQHPTTYWKTLFWSVLVQIASVGITAVVAIAFGIAVPWWAFWVFVPLVWLATMLPISIGGLGLREATFVPLFALVGVSTENALVLSLGTYITLILFGLFGSLVFATTMGNVKIRDLR